MKNREEQVRHLRIKANFHASKSAYHEKKSSQHNAKANLLDSGATTQNLKNADTRKYEIGALAEHHMLTNPDSDFAYVLRKLMNNNIRDFRRHLFTEHHGIDPEPPPGSNAALHAIAALKRREAKILKTARRKFVKQFDVAS